MKDMKSSRLFRPRRNGACQKVQSHVIRKGVTNALTVYTTTTLWFFVFLQETFIYNRPPHSALENQTLFLHYYELTENYDRLVPFGCRVEAYISKENRCKLEGTTKFGIFPRFSNNSTELIVLDFESAEVINAPSPSSF